MRFPWANSLRLRNKELGAASLPFCNKYNPGDRLLQTTLTSNCCRYVSLSASQIQSQRVQVPTPLRNPHQIRVKPSTVGRTHWFATVTIVTTESLQYLSMDPKTMTSGQNLSAETIVWYLRWWYAKAHFTYLLYDFRSCEIPCSWKDNSLTNRILTTRKQADRSPFNLSCRKYRHPWKSEGVQSRSSEEFESDQTDTSVCSVSMNALYGVWDRAILLLVLPRAKGNWNRKSEAQTQSP